MKKLFFLLFLILSFNSFTQYKTSIGLNLPLLIDNQLDLTLQHSFHKRIRLVMTFGGSNNTRGTFRNGKNIFFRFEPSNTEFSQTILEDKINGIYGKMGFNFIFNLPSFFNTQENKQNSNLKFYLGPLVGVSRFKQVANISRNYFAKYSTTGIISPARIINEDFTEKGVLAGTGFASGFTISASDFISADLGLEFLGFERKSAFQNKTHTIGLGTILTMRVNYNIKSK